MTTVVHIITALGLGGAERMLFYIASRNVGASDTRQIVVSLSDEGVYGAELRKAGVELECLGMRRGHPSFGAYWRLTRLLRQRRPDVVMTWLYHADLLGTLAALSAGAPRIIWNIGCSDMDLSLYSPFTRWIVGCLALISWVPWGVATNSHAGRRAHERLGYRPKQWIYLPNGFDTDEWKPDSQTRAAVRRELGFSDDNVVVGMVARVDPQKDYANFLEAAASLAARHPRLRILLVGQGTRQLDIPDMLKPLTVALGPRRDVSRLMRALDVMVLSSTTEGFPLVIGEAMATGVPCVATDVGDAAMIIGRSGKVVPPRAPEALAAAIEELIDMSPEGRRALSALARDRIASEFSIARCLSRYGDLFRLPEKHEDGSGAPRVSGSNP